MGSLGDVHEINAYGFCYVSLSVPLSTYFNSRTAGMILIKFGMDIVPLGATPNSYF
jgi:hypothetical protein